MVFPIMVTQLLPPGITGLVLAGLVAAIMSSIDSTLNSASTLLSVDFIQPRYPDISGRRMRRIGTFATLGFMVIAAVWAPIIQGFPGLFAYLQSMLGYIVPPVVIIFMVGLFWPRGNAAGALTTLIVGHSVSVVVFVLDQMFGLVPIHFTITAGILTAFCALVFVVASRMLGETPRAKQIDELTWSKRYAEPAEGLPWWQDYRAQSVVVLSLTFIIVALFW